MMGTVAMDVALNTNDGKPVPNDNSETVTVTLTMLVFQPSGMTPVWRELHPLLATCHPRS